MATIDTNVINQFKASAGTYGCMSQFSEITGFANNKNNEQAIMSAFEMYGLPPQNRPSEKNSGLFGRWNDYCDWDRGIYKFYIAAKLFKAYSAIDLSPNNCGKIKQVISFLEQEKLNADKAGVFDPATRDTTLGVINDMQTRYMVGYSNLDCDNLIAEEEQSNIEEQITEQEKKTEAALNKITPTKIFIVGIGGVIVILGIVMLLRRK